MYTQLSADYKYSVIAAAVYAREIEHFHYDFDRVNFEYLIEILPDGKYKIDVQQRLEDTLLQLDNVRSIHSALLSQIDDQDAYQRAVSIAKQEREDKKK